MTRHLASSRLCRLWVCGVCVVAWVAVALTTSAQEAPLVDRAVGDLDPLATSSRYLDPVYSNDLNRTRLFQVQDPDPLLGTRSQFRYEAPGFRATFDRPDYLTLSKDGVTLNQAPTLDGNFIDLIPPGTVFDLTTPTPRQIAVPPSAEMLRWRVDTRWDGYRPPQPRHQGLRPWDHLPRFTPTSPMQTTAPSEQLPEVKLQPWVTAEDLREHEAEVPVITDRVVLPGDPDTVEAQVEKQPDAPSEQDRQEDAEIPEKPEPGA